jgi:FAD/FMN-containing dehydrogenase
VQQALALLREVRALWQFWLHAPGRDAGSPMVARAAAALFDQLQDHSLRASLEAQILKPLQRCLPAPPGAHLDELQAHPQAEVLRGRVWVALHMHAGDGNVHTNIPVNSDNYAMLQTAHEAVARIMALARAGRRDQRRARHRHHQARVPDRRRDGGLHRLQGRGSTPRAASTRASCCAARRCGPGDDVLPPT